MEPRDSQLRQPTNTSKTQQTLSCPLCEQDDVTSAWHPDAFAYGSGASRVELRVQVPVRQCRSCGFEFLDHEAEELKHNEICGHLDVLSPAEIRRIRENRGLSRAAFAKLTGLGEASLNRWENGLSIQSRSKDNFLRILAGNPDAITMLQIRAADFQSATPSAARHVSI